MSPTVKDHESYLKFETSNDGEFLMYCFKIYYNTYYEPIDFELIQKIKQRIEDFKKQGK